MKTLLIETILSQVRLKILKESQRFSKSFKES